MTRITGWIAVALAVSAAFVAPAAAEAANNRILILMTTGFNNEEYWVPSMLFRAAGYDVTVAAPQKGRIAFNDKGPSPRDAVADISLDEVDVADYDALVIPGGYSPGNLEKIPRSIEIVRQWWKTGKPIAAVCHGPRLLMRAGLLEDRVMTCLYSVKNELADEWTKGAYGKYLDEPVVIDEPLITSRYPRDSAAFALTVMKALEPASGLKLPHQPAKVAVVATGLESHNRWLLRDAVRPLNTEVTLIEEPALGKMVADEAFKPGDFDLLMVVDGPGDEKLKANADFKKLVKAFQDADVPVAAANEADAVVRAVGQPADVAFEGEMGTILRQMVVLSHKDKTGKPMPNEAAEPEGLAVYLDEGFDDLAYAATVAWAASYDKPLRRVGTQDGWVRSAAGVPVRTQAVGAVPAGAVKIFAKGAEAPAGAADGLEAFLRKARQDNPDGPQAVLALQKGFDGHAALAALAAMRVEGFRVAIVGPAEGVVRGLNGVELKAEATYADAPQVGKGSFVVAPGGLWPEKAAARQAEQPAWIETQAEADAARLQYLLARYDAGATLVAFGFDSLLLGRQERFAGHKFASSDQTVWSFGKSAGKYSDEPALWSTDRLLTIKGLGGLREAGRLLRESRQN